MSKARKKAARSQEAGLSRLSRSRYLGLGIAALALLVLLVYGRSFGYGFVDFDDPDLLLENPAVRALSPRAIFTPEMGKTYQPMRVLSYAIDYSLWGLNPAGYHVINTLLHLAAAVLLLLFLDRLLPLLRPSASLRENRGLALVVTMLFALHPISVESVAWVTSRKYGLLATFAFLSLYLFCEFRRRGGVGWLAGSSAAALAAALSSPFGVTMPVLILLLERAHNPRPDWRICLPYLICLLVAIPLLGNAAVSSTDADYDVIKTGVGLLWLPRMLAVLGIYARNLLLPLWLNASTVNHVDYARMAVLIALMAALVLYGLWWVIREYRKGQLLPAFCLLWVVVILLPVSGLVPISTLYADRYLYLPQVGVWLLLGHLLAARVPVKVVPAIAGVLVLTMVIGSSKRCVVWRDSIALWSDCVAKDDRNFRAHSSLASNYADAGNNELARQHFEAAISRNPQDAFAYYNMALMLVNQGQHAEARERFLKASELRPDKVDVWMNLAAVSRDLSDWEGAIRYANTALEAAPDLALPLIHRATAYAAMNQPDDARRDFEAALARDANSAKAHYGLAGFSMVAGDLASAIASYECAAALAPQEFGIHTNLGNAYFKAERFEEAVASYRRAVAIQPHPGVYRNLANALDKLGRNAEAAAARANAPR